MLVGLMNHPARPVAEELRSIAGRGFDFVDLTLEPPLAWPADGRAIAATLSDTRLHAVGHTAYFLPIASPFPELRRQARRLFCAALDAFAEAGVALVNVHPDPMTRLFPVEEVVQRNAEAIAALAEDAAGRGIELMVENLGRSFGRPDDLAPILEADARLGFHLDVGHANLGLARGGRTSRPRSWTRSASACGTSISPTTSASTTSTCRSAPGASTGARPRAYFAARAGTGR